MFGMGTLLLLIMVWTVIARLFSISTPYQMELTKTFHIWLVFVGSSLLISLDANPRVEIFYDKVLRSKNVTFKKCYLTLVQLLTLFFVALCFFEGIKQVPAYLKQTTTYLRYSVIWTNGAAVFGFGLMSFRCVLKIMGYWCGLDLNPTTENDDDVPLTGTVAEDKTGGGEE
ncbi:MAG: TRAP transporter small permease subunit, partial [Alphaproteobacteria bacterium]|nr:TRAP transporter small permease subunit [Alphaproteobacteria bacterium]